MHCRLLADRQLGRSGGAGKQQARTRFPVAHRAAQAHLLSLPDLDHGHAGNHRVGVLQQVGLTWGGWIKCAQATRDSNVAQQPPCSPWSSAALKTQAGTAGEPPQRHASDTLSIATTEHAEQYTLYDHAEQTKRTSNAALLTVSLAPMTRARSKPSISGFTWGSKQGGGTGVSRVEVEMGVCRRYQRGAERKK